MAARLLDVAFAGLLFGLSIFLWVVADGFRESARFAQADADYWPKLVFGTMAVLALIYLVRSALSLRGATTETRAGASSPNWESALRIGAMGALILAYYFAFQHLGFVIATILFLWLASLTIPYDRMWVRLAFAPIFTVLLTLFFTRVLSLPLPRGSGVFYDLNVLFF